MLNRKMVNGLVRPNHMQTLTSGNTSKLVIISVTAG